MWWLSLYACVVLTFLLRMACLSEPCYRFLLPTVPSHLTINISEGTNFTLPFELDCSNCPENSNQSVSVYVMRPSEQISLIMDFCFVIFEEGNCSSIDEQKCRCNSVTMATGFVLTKTVTKNDSGTWLWRSGVRFETNITVNVQENLMQGSTGYDVTDVTIGGLHKQINVSTTEVSDSSADLTTPETVLSGPTTPIDKVIQSTDSSTKDTAGETSNTDSIHHDNTSINDNNDEHVETTTTPAITREVRRTEHSIVTGLVFGGVSIAVVIVVFVIVLRRRRRKIRKRRGYCVNLTPVSETNNDVLVTTQRHPILLEVV